MVPSWRDVLARYRVPTTLETVRQRRRFEIRTDGDRVVATPSSSGKSRGITQRDFERTAPLLLRAAESAEVLQASQNTAYIRAILDDFERRD